MAMDHAWDGDPYGLPSHHGTFVRVSQNYGLGVGAQATYLPLMAEGGEGIEHGS